MNIPECERSQASNWTDPISVHLNVHPTDLLYTTLFGTSFHHCNSSTQLALIIDSKLFFLFWYDRRWRICVLTQLGNSWFISKDSVLLLCSTCNGPHLYICCFHRLHLCLTKGENSSIDLEVFLFFKKEEVGEGFKFLSPTYSQIYSLRHIYPSMYMRGNCPKAHPFLL